jgi:rifampicin phosphotransferase
VAGAAYVHAARAVYGADNVSPIGRKDKVRRLTVPLVAASPDRAAVGGKAAALAELLRAGFPVPPGFVVTTDAYRSFLAANGLDRQTTDLHEAICAAPIPAEIELAVTGAYAELCDGDPIAVAVRSSATVEDLPTGSFAGQHDTFLNVRGDDAVLDAIRRCWASLWSARAILYRMHHGDGAAPEQAVLVQQLVAADSAGVLFTVNPVGCADELVIEAGRGLGEHVVAGGIVPDRITLDRTTLRMKDVRGTGRDAGVAALDDGEIAELARLGTAIETNYGAPQDIEWAIAGGKAYVLQARPVTTTGADDAWPALGGGTPQPFDLWTRANVGEIWPDPVSPLVASMVPVIVGAAVRHSFRTLKGPLLDQIRWAGRFYGRVYYNEGALRHVLGEELGLPSAFIDRTRGTQAENGADGSRIRPLRIVRRLPVLVPLATGQRRTARDLEALIPRIDRWTAEFDDRRLGEESDEALWSDAMTWLRRTTETMQLQNEVTGRALASFALLERLVVRWSGRHDLAHELITGLSSIEAAEIGPALARLADLLCDAGLAPLMTSLDPEEALQRLRELPDAAEFNELFDEFLRRHGHRCANEAEWLNPRWRDAPEQVIELVATYLATSRTAEPAGGDALRVRHRAAGRWVDSLHPIRRRILWAVVRRAQDAIRLRDNGKSAAIKVSYPARRIAVVLGERWTERGWLERPEDVFFLTVEDLEGAIEAGSPAAAQLDPIRLVRGRRRALEAWFDVVAPDVLGPDGRPAGRVAGAAPSGRRLEGISAGTGRVRGTARVIQDPRTALTMKPGEILVTRAVDAAWTATFPLLGGLVTEIGGSLSHAAIIAREYGLPAVVGVDNATSWIRDGQTIVIDGSAGKVEFEPIVAGGRGDGEPDDAVG